MPSGVGVDPEEEIELVGGGFDDAVEVAGLEGSVEEEFLLGIEGGIHAFEGSVEEGGLVVRFLSLRNHFTRTPMRVGFTIFCMLTP